MKQVAGLVGCAASVLVVAVVVSTSTTYAQVQVRAEISGPPGIKFGQGFAVVPDLTGDGAPDLVVGAPGANARAGQVSLYSGATLQLVATRNGVHPNGGLGSDFSVADFDSNGTPDIVACSEWQNWPLDGLSEVAVLSSQSLVTLWSKSGSGEAQFGASAKVYPLTGGGFGMVIVESQSNCAGTDAGAAYRFTISGSVVWSTCAAGAWDFGV